jgi:hypothetical protein
LEATSLSWDLSGSIVLTADGGIMLIRRKPEKRCKNLASLPLYTPQQSSEITDG